MGKTGTVGAKAKAAGRKASEAGTKSRKAAEEKGVVEGPLGYKFKPEAHALDRRRYVTVEVSIAKVDRALAGDENFYVGPGGTGAAIAGRYQQFRQFLERARREGIAIEMPRMQISDARGDITISNGRHRFAVFRDMGARTIPVSVPRADAGKIRAKYGAK